MPPTLRRLIGQLGWVLLPGIAREIEAGARPAHMARLKAAMVEARKDRAARSGATEDLQDVLAAGWRGAFGNSFHGSRAADRLARTIREHGASLDELRRLLASGRYRRLVEIGCGEGHALRHVMSGAPPDISAVGIDLNEGAIAGAIRLSAADPRLSFVVGDGAGWLANAPQAGTVLYTNGGVLEYVAPATIAAMLAALASAGPAAVVFVEPLDPGHDLSTDPSSRVFGVERSFSHNYPGILASAGFRIALQTESQSERIRWIQVAAERP